MKVNKQMPINQLVQYCHHQYRSKNGQCSSCPNKQSDCCQSDNCSLCFSEMFFGSSGRIFNCEFSTFSYVCRYIFQYSSEILHLLQNIKTTFKKDNNFRYDKLNIISIGCGPCSEAFAFDAFIREIGFDNTKVSFTGFDTNPTWNNVHHQVKTVLPFSTEIINQDCFTYIGQKQDFVYPNILIMNYLFSDIAKHGNLNQFIDNVVIKIIDKMPPKSVIIVNDINHFTVRNYYKILINKAKNNNELTNILMGFIINHENSTSDYKSYRYSYNNIFSTLKAGAIRVLMAFYQTRTSCTSAQLLIYKKSNKI